MIGVQARMGRARVSTFRMWYFRFLLLVALAAIIAGVVGLFTSGALWGSLFKLFMGLYFLFLVFFRFPPVSHPESDASIFGLPSLPLTKDRISRKN